MLFLNRPEQGAHDFDRESPSLYRFEIDLGRGEVEQTQVADWFCEFPRIHEGHLGHPYRYGYSVSRTMRPRGTQGPEFDAIVRYDWETGRVETRSFGAQAGVGEPVFVPRSGAKEEGEGYVLVLVYDRTRDTSDFYVLSAEDLAGDPLAVIELPHRVPYGFHGNWVPAVG
jgi:carotenoid cleavage dioxygenase